MDENNEPSSVFANGYHRQYEFENGYGVSVIWNLASYGHDDMLFEEAVVDLETDDLVYDTVVTDDVVGWLDFYGVVDVLEKVRSLPPKDKEFVPPLYCKDCRYYMNSRERNSKCVCGWGDPYGYCKWGVRRG